MDFLQLLHKSLLIACSLADTDHCKHCPTSPLIVEMQAQLSARCPSSRACRSKDEKYSCHQHIKEQYLLTGFTGGRLRTCDLCKRQCKDFAEVMCCAALFQLPTTLFKLFELGRAQSHNESCYKTFGQTDCDLCESQKSSPQGHPNGRAERILEQVLSRDCYIFR